ncbi:dipeptide ABC transporter ATP-binding protein [Streptomyces himalayensis]|uniref:ABC transporter ATP-binding protein n=1 Tax=Streptomyces himalayensis subsp. himalayensis TaxID=2756131 RepID=A0A7W0I805_9ACTN|nr:ABC transporter ATP-binding protein [Streptomyces himalayensis]MBA2945546.1 ABC transporter ATP-binding protein [Streptomyces himalayensis subsp. himalayensis]
MTPEQPTGSAAEADPAPAESLIDVQGLTVDFPTGEETVRAVDDLSFRLTAGQALGIVGESGSGKSTVAAALLGLHRGTGARLTGTVRVGGIDVGTASVRELHRLRGGTAAMVFQDPLSSLDPYMAIGDQIAEVHRTHAPHVSRRSARERAVAVLDRVGIPDAARRSRSRPHEFSGGMRQRALIAMALACDPRVLVADEPTTALDVTVQAQILDLLHDLRTETGMGLVLVSHDLGVVAGSVEDMLVMRGGRAVERGPVGTVLSAPQRPYTRELLAAVPRVETRRVPVASTAVPSSASGGDVLLEAVEVRREFGRRKDRTVAVDGVSLTVAQGETLGVVGESGSGKTTLGRMLVRLLEPSGGSVRYGGRELTGIHSDLQMVFQDPVSSLNPRRSIGESVADPLRAAGTLTDAEITRRARELLERVGLDPRWYHRYPHEFSGGQRQRVGIARALAPGPKLVVCDEPVSALDVTTQAQVLDLLAELQRDLGLALVLIAHDLAVVRHASDRVVVMRQGTVVEEGPADTVYDAPQNPYTKALLAAVPVLDPAEAALRRAARRSADSGVLRAAAR